jgi:HD-like signal output (HDOD) protein
VPRLWSHSWQTADLAQHICRDKQLSRKAGEEAFMAGLLHEMGRLILIDNFPERFQAACVAARQSNSPLAPRLREVFQTGAPQITAYLLELWGMPVNVIEAIATQDKPESQPPGAFSLAAVLYLADHIACRKSPPDDLALEDWNTAYLQSIGCADDVPVWENLSLEPAPGGVD